MQLLWVWTAGRGMSGLGSVLGLPSWAWDFLRGLGLWLGLGLGFLGGFGHDVGTHTLVGRRGGGRDEKIAARDGDEERGLQYGDPHCVDRRLVGVGPVDPKLIHLQPKSLRVGVTSRASGMGNAPSGKRVWGPQG